MKTQLVIFGITGDLSTRKLLPSLEAILDDKKDLELSVIGVSRRQVDLDDLVGGYPKLRLSTEIFTMDLAQQEEYARLKTFLEQNDADQTIFYLSVPPGAATSIVDFLGEVGLNTAKHRILFEKPFGFDLASAQDFIARTDRYFTDDQLYRIDHYMAKEIAAEILRLRREALDGDLQKTIKSITIVASEKIGIEGRAQFYEQTGALRDFIQGHLMQLLALTLIRTPTNEPLPVQRLRALKTIQPAAPEQAIRAQYSDYQQEAENPGSQVETFVALLLESNDPAWQGVPLRLVTGKALDEKRSYIEIEYQDGSIRTLEEGKILARDGDRQLDAYERVLLEAIEGRKDIFTSGAEVLRSWEILAPLQEAWSMDSEPLKQYTTGAHYRSLFDK